MEGRVFDSNVYKTLGRGVATLLALYGMVEASEYFGWEPFKNNVILFLSIAFNIWLVSEIIIHFARLRYIEKNKTLPSVLTEELDRLSKNGEYEAILRHQKNFSRSLLVEGKYKERIRLGEIAEDAALKLGRKEIQVATLIDDLGWTLVTLKEYSKARQKLLHGLKIAKEINNSYWVAKAYRHLAAIKIEGSDYKGAYQLIEKAHEAAIQIDDVRLKDEMLAGIEYGKTIVHLFKIEPENALESLRKSEQLRLKGGDKSRIVKIFALKGKIAEVLNDMLLAKDCYRHGLTEAKEIGRKDEEIRNHYGLSRVYEAEGNKTKAQFHFKQAEVLNKESPVSVEMTDEAIELIKLHKAK